MNYYDTDLDCNDVQLFFLLFSDSLMTMHKCMHMCVYMHFLSVIWLMFCTNNLITLSNYVYDYI